MSGLEIWDARDPGGRRRWEAVYADWEKAEPFAHPAYLEALAGPGEEPLAAFAGAADDWILYPFLLRRIPGEDALRDISTAYGYGGPYAGGEEGGRAGAFWEAFDAWCAGAGVVSEVVRLSLFDEQLAPYPGERSERLQNVVRDLVPEPEELWRDYEHKVRKNVKRARRSGVSIEVDREAERLGDFLRIYRQTMDRRGAAARYDFPPELFEALGADLGEGVAYFHALLDGRVVSTELVLLGGETAYSFLGGTDAAAFDARPNDLLKHELILWAREAGMRRYVLGGGQAHGDGIFRFKRSFAPGGIVPFSLGHRVLDRDAYERLVEARVAEGRRRRGGWDPEPSFFPAYRAALPDHGAGT